MTGGRRFACLIAAGLVLAAPIAQAAGKDPAALASETYRRGKAAYDNALYTSGAHNVAAADAQFAAAARDFTAADDISANHVALESAVLAILRIEKPTSADAVLAMRIVDRATQRGESSADDLQKARAKYARMVGRIALVCRDASPCPARIDGEPAKPVTWVSPGSHDVEWEQGGRGSVTVDAGGAVDAHAPAPPRVEKSDKTEGIAPTWFWVGIGLTTIGLGASIASGIDTLHKHQVFAAQATAAGQDDGRSAQLRTNVLFAVTGVLAVATAGVGIFAVGWGRGQKTSTTVDLQARGLGIALTMHR
jgi:hypothetical protein